MDVLVFTDQPKLASSFKLKARGPHRLRVAGWSEFRKQVAAQAAPALCYLDLATLPEGRLPGCLRLLRSRPHLSQLRQQLPNLRPRYCHFHRHPRQLRPSHRLVPANEARSRSSRASFMSV